MSVDMYLNTCIVGRVEAMERQRNTLNGNARYVVALCTEDGTMLRTRTQPNSSVAFYIDGRDFAERTSHFRTDSRGRIREAHAADHCPHCPKDGA